MQKLLTWTIFEVNSKTEIQGVMFRGKLRKFATVTMELNFLIENDEAKKTCIRFAILDEDAGHVTVTRLTKFIKEICPDAEVSFQLQSIANPVLSKLQVNDLSRYKI